jgi:hypothetical protein
MHTIETVPKPHSKIVERGMQLAYPRQMLLNRMYKVI